MSSYSLSMACLCVASEHNIIEITAPLHPISTHILNELSAGP
jgi:hypothetical protein